MVNYSYLVFRSVVQLVERRSPKPNVVSSSLATPAIDFIHFLVFTYNPYGDFFLNLLIKVKVKGGKENDRRNRKR